MVPACVESQRLTAYLMRTDIRIWFLISCAGQNPTEGVTHGGAGRRSREADNTVVAI
jgi:hypothetical protein